MTIEYRTNYPVTAESVANVFRRSGIRRPVDNLARIQKMLDHADLTVSAWDGERLIGIGRALVSQIQEIIGNDTMLLLLSAPEAMVYYPHIGFEKAENAWIIHRQE